MADFIFVVVVIIGFFALCRVRGRTAIASSGPTRTSPISARLSEVTT